MGNGSLQCDPLFFELVTTRLKLIVGLGNPGPKHELDRHNAGYWFVDTLSRRHCGNFSGDRKFHGDVARIDVDGNDLRLLKPTTFMNVSGRSVQSLISYLNIDPTEVLVAHDEIDLDSGTVRLKRGGGPGGHNGLRDVIAHIGGDFYRLRLGVGHPGHKDEVVDYVLRRAGKEDEEKLISCIADAIDVLPILLGHGENRAMTKLHSRGVKPKPYRKAKDDSEPDGNGDGDGEKES